LVSKTQNLKETIN